MSYKNNLNILTMKLHDPLVKQKVQTKENNILFYEDAYNKKDYYKRKMIFNMFGNSLTEIENFKISLSESFNTVINKEFAYQNSEVIKECFEISCNILYDRQILSEVIEKQKKYEIDYVIDFFRYVLRIFIKRYNNTFILSKNQCYDIRRLCLRLLQVNNYHKQFITVINKLSAREIIYYLKDIVIEKDDGLK